jgi:hypothetical protein
MSGEQMTTSMYIQVNVKRKKEISTQLSNGVTNN